MNSLIAIYIIGTLLAVIFHLVFYKKGRFDRPYPTTFAGYACLLGWPLIIAFAIAMVLTGLCITLIEAHRDFRKETG